MDEQTIHCPCCGEVITIVRIGAGEPYYGKCLPCRKGFALEIIELTLEDMVDELDGT